MTEQLMCMFVAQLGTEGLANQTIKCYLLAVRHYSIMAGQGDPFGPGAFPVLQYILRGVRRSPRAPAQPRLPVKPQILRHLKSQWTCHAGELKYMMLWAACCAGFFGFLRAGEFTSQPGEDFEPSSSLTPEDITVDDHSNPSMVCMQDGSIPTWSGYFSRPHRPRPMSCGGLTGSPPSSTWATFHR